MEKPLGLSIYFFNHEDWLQLYNCTFYNVEEVPVGLRQHVVYGILALLLFFLYETLYMPCLYAMMHKELRRSFCYRLMLQMSIFEVLTLPLSAGIPGMFSITGSMFCSYPRFAYISGCFVFPLWIAYTTSAIILAVNRCCSMTNQFMWAFQGSFRQTLWLCVSPIVGLVMLFSASPLIFNSIHGAWFFDPHLGYHDDHYNKYISYVHSFNNVIFCTVVPFVYVLCFLQNRGLTRLSSVTTQVQTRQLFFQTFIVNITITTVAVIYTVMQYLPLPEICASISQITWIVVEGTPPIVYLTMNRSIRRIVFGRHIQMKNVAPHDTTAMASSEVEGAYMVVIVGEGVAVVFSMAGDGTEGGFPGVVVKERYSYIGWIIKLRFQ